MSKTTSSMKRLSLTMNTGTLSITDLYTHIEKASNPELAGVISKAFEQSKAEQQQFVTATKKETLKEIHDKDLATRGDLLAVKNEIKAEIYKEVSSAKCQVIGSIVLATNRIVRFSNM